MMRSAQFERAYEFLPARVEARQAPPEPLWEGEHEEDFAPEPRGARVLDLDLVPDEDDDLAEELPLHRVAPATVALGASAVLLVTILAARALLGGAPPATSDAGRPPVTAGPVAATPVALPSTPAPATLESRPAAAAALKPKRPTPSPTGRR
jgi:hypothetical protein